MGVALTLKTKKMLRGAGFLSVAASVAVAFGVATSATAGDDKSANEVAGYEKTGEEVNCLRLSMVRDSDPVDDYMILFEVRGGAMYVNELNGRCAGLEREKRFSYRTSQAQICEGDVISVFDSFGTYRGSCSLGAFQALADASPER